MSAPPELSDDEGLPHDLRHGAAWSPQQELVPPLPVDYPVLAQPNPSQHRVDAELMFTLAQVIDSEESEDGNPEADQGEREVIQVSNESEEEPASPDKLKQYNELGYFSDLRSTQSDPGTFGGIVNFQLMMKQLKLSMGSQLTPTSRPNPSPTKRYVGENLIVPRIHLERTRKIPYVSLDRYEIEKYESKKDSSEKCQGMIDQENLVRDTDEEQGEAAAEAEIAIPTIEEMIANPTPSTSGGSRAKVRPIGVAFLMEQFGSLIGHGQNLFLQGAEIDGNMEANLEKLAHQAALKHALSTSSIDAKAVNEKLERYKDCVQNLTWQRRRVLEILIAQQEKAEAAINCGLEPTLSQLRLTIDEVQTVFDDIEPEVEEPEADVLDISHLSSNLSEPGLCDPENPCSGEGPCRHMHGE